MNINELTSFEIATISGGSDIIRELEERFPFGEWDGNTFWPNGKPKEPFPGPVTT